MTRTRFPKEAPVCAVRNGNSHWAGTMVELVALKFVTDRENPFSGLKVWHLCNQPHFGWVWTPHKDLRPRTPAAREMLALVRNG